MTTYVEAVRLPAVSEEFIKTIDDTWEIPNIVPGADRDTLMYNAGARAVVDWIKHHAHVKSTPDPVAVQKAAIRYGS